MFDFLSNIPHYYLMAWTFNLCALIAFLIFFDINLKTIKKFIGRIGKVKKKSRRVKDKSDKKIKLVDDEFYKKAVIEVFGVEAKTVGDIMMYLERKLKKKELSRYQVIDLE